MIQEVSGDILLSKAQVIAHSVAPNDHFGSGLALGLRERSPQMVKDFRHFCQSTHPKAGTIWAWMGPGGQRIVSLLTQEAEYGHHGATAGPAHIEYVRSALHALRKFADAEKVESLALPKIATTAGRLKWDDVYPLVREYFGNAAFPVYLYTTFHKDVASDESVRKT